MRLSEKDLWEKRYRKASTFLSNSNSPRKISKFVKGFLPDSLSEFMSSYDQYLLWNVIYPAYMPRSRIRALEIGSAPGNFLVKLSKRFDVEPYGIEYTEAGTLLNKKIFMDNQLDPQNIIYDDFFSDGFQTNYKEFFDVVISRGFIEHFTNPEEVIEKHLHLLRKGGLVFITIPNYSGVNYFIQHVLNKKILPIHNIKIMDKRNFTNLFSGKSLNALKCDYWGTFNFSLFNSKPSYKPILNVCEKIQLLLNLFFRLLFRENELKIKFTSPHLIFIGEKQ